MLFPLLFPSAVCEGQRYLFDTIREPSVCNFTAAEGLEVCHWRSLSPGAAKNCQTAFLQNLELLRVTTSLNSKSLAYFISARSQLAFGKRRKQKFGHQNCIFCTSGEKSLKKRLQTNIFYLSVFME